MDRAAVGLSGDMTVLEEVDAEFARFYRDTYVQMERVAFLLSGSAAAAADISHDCYVELYRRWASVTSPRAYVRRSIAHAAATRHARSQRELRDWRAAGALRAGDEHPLEYLADAIGALPYRQRAVIVLKFYCDLTEAQIADATGLRPGSVGPTVTRALARLRKDIDR